MVFWMHVLLFNRNSHQLFDGYGLIIYETHPPYIIYAYWRDDKIAHHIIRYIGGYGNEVDYNASSGNAIVKYANKKISAFRKYEGGYLNFAYNGYGTLTSWNGTQCKGKFSNGNPQGSYSITYQNGTITMGSFNDCNQLANDDMILNDYE